MLSKQVAFIHVFNIFTDTETSTHSRALHTFGKGSPVAMGGLASQTKLHAPQIETGNTINQLRFGQF